MFEVEFYDNGIISEDKLKYVVIQAEYDGKWILVRHKDRETWEIPGGHIEVGEIPKDAASRELYEETGAKNFTLKLLCIYSARHLKNNTISYGQLYYSKVTELDNLPDSEIEEIKFANSLPENISYPHILPFLFQKVKELRYEKKEII